MPSPRYRNRRATLLLPGWFEATRALAAAKDERLLPNANTAVKGGEDPPVVGSSASSDDVDGVSTDCPQVAHEQIVLELLTGLRLPAGALPGASCRRGEHVSDDVVCVDLVTMIADRDHARLMPISNSSLASDEVTALLDSVNALVASDGCRFSPGSQFSEWYFEGWPADALNTWPALALAERNLGLHMPRQESAGHWRRLITEMQMLLHDHPVNEARASAGKPVINGLWFWGGAPAPAAESVDEVFAVSALDSFASGAASLCGATKLPDNPEEGLAWLRQCQQQLSDASVSSEPCDAHWLVVDLTLMHALLDGHGDRLTAARAGLHDAWVAPLTRALEDNTLDRLDVMDERGHSETVWRHSGLQQRLLGYVQRSLSRFLR